MTNCVYGAFRGGCCLKLIAQIAGLPCGGGRTTCWALPRLIISLPSQPCADCRHHSTCVWAVKRRVFYLEVCAPPRESLGLGHLQGRGCWELGCVLDQGLNFPLKMRKKVYGTLPWECLLLFEAAALILGKDYFISPCFFLSFFPFVFLLLLFRHCRFRVDLFRDRVPHPLFLSPSHFILCFLFRAHPLPLPAPYPLLPKQHPRTPFLFLYLLYSSLLTHDRLCN